MVFAPRGVSTSWGVHWSNWGVAATRGCLVLGGPGLGGGAVSQHAGEAEQPPCELESYTPVKTLPWPNFIAAGNCSIFRTDVPFGYPPLFLEFVQEVPS